MLDIMSKGKSTVLIIGGDSFIGRSFTEAYKDKISLKLVSRISTQFPDEHILKDLFSIPDSVFKNIEVVINFAALVHDPDIKDKSLYEKINHQLVLNLAAKARRAGVRLFVQLSTVAVYGNNQKISVSSPVNPNNAYGMSKFHADQGLLTMQDENFKVAIIRPPSVYGGKNPPGNMIRLIRLVNKGLPLPFKGIKNSRDFINIHNLVQYIFIIITEQIYGVFLVSDNQPVSTEYLIHLINRSLCQPDILFKIPEGLIKFFKRFKPEGYNKLFGSLQIINCFPYEEIITRYSVESGIDEMVMEYVGRKEIRKIVISNSGQQNRS
jgi:UDP-glucose 4-epimerase